MSTIYIQNLNEKVSPNTLRKELSSIFSSYQPISIHVKKTLALKGQAFISFKSDHSDEIIKKFQNFKVFKKPMKISIAKHKSYDVLGSNEVETMKNLRRWKKTGKPNNTLILNLDYGHEPDKSQEPQPSSAADDIEWQEKLNNIFEEFEGFVNLRIIKVKSIVFIEFENIEFAKSCFETIDIEVLKNVGILSYAK